MTKFDGFPEKIINSATSCSCDWHKNRARCSPGPAHSCNNAAKDKSMTEKIGLKNTEEADDNEQAEKSCKQSSGSISLTKLWNVV